MKNINFESLKNSFDNFNKNIIKDNSKILFRVVDTIYENSNKIFKIYKNSEIYNLKLNILKYIFKIIKKEKNTGDIKNFVKELNYNYKKQQVIVNSIADLKLNLEEFQKNINEKNRIEKENELIFDNIIKNFINFFSETKEYCDKFNKILERDKFNEIDKINFIIKFDDNLYKKNFENIFDLRYILQEYYDDIFNKNFNNCNYDNDFFEKYFISLFTDKCNLKYKSNKSQKNVFEAFCINFFKLELNIQYDNDNFDSNMSAGKRAILLLKFLIEIDQDKYPILIDQPEDDLDSKSIYKYLTNYIKETKKNRQIIIVSHNPNIVVGCDSEEVIIAKQQNKKFFYKSGSLENTYNKNLNNNLIENDNISIKKNVCDILEGGETAFKIRELKYDINNNNNNI